MATWDWSARHTPVSGTVNAVTGLVAAASVATEAHITAPWPLLAAGVGTMGSIIGGLARDESQKLTRGHLVHRAACWMGAGGWLSYVLAAHNDPLTWPTAFSLGAGGLSMGLIARGLATRKAKKLSAQQAAQASMFLKGMAAQWKDRIERCCSVKVDHIIAIEDWPKKSGFTIEVKLADGGTWEQLRAHTDRMASDADLDEGCGIEVQHGIKRSRALVKVQTINALHGEHMLPDDWSPLDFNEDFDIGPERDFTPAVINMRQSSTMVAGQKRSGKTNELQAIISKLMRMPNVLVWIIDFNGGGLALPWIQAWNEMGRPGNPPIDWVAHTPDEALMMVTAASEIAKKRKIAYQQLMRQQNTDLLPLTPEIPGIVIVMDECAEILGTAVTDQTMRRIEEKYLEVLRIAGAVGINEITCGLRATVDVFGSTMIKAQSQNRIGMRMGDVEEIAYLIGWDAKIQPADMPGQGYGCYTNGERSALFKGWRVTPNIITKGVAETNQLRPALDKVSLSVVPEGYASRWDRARALFSAHADADGNVVINDEGPKISMEKPEPPEPEGNPAKPEPPRDSVSWAFDGPRGSNAWLDENGNGKSERQMFDEIMEASGIKPEDWDDPTKWPSDGGIPDAPDPESDDEVGVEQFKGIIFGIVKGSGENGIKPADILRVLERTFPNQKVPVIKTITRWLKQDNRIWQPTGYGTYAVRPKKED